MASQEESASREEDSGTNGKPAREAGDQPLSEDASALPEDVPADSAAKVSPMLAAEEQEGKSVDIKPNASAATMPETAKVHEQKRSGAFALLGMTFLSTLAFVKSGRSKE